MPAPDRPARPLRTATVTRTERFHRDLVRVHLAGDDLRAIGPLSATDSYVKLVFGDVTRTYTVRSHDPAAGTMAIDFVVHGDEGLAGPWAARAVPGDTISFRGPGGAWAPDPSAARHLFVGDESAAPAIAAALEALPREAQATVFLEVADASTHVPLPETAADVRWVHRDGAPCGVALVEAVRAQPVPDGVEVFLHGNFDMVKDLRRYLLVECGVPKERTSISGYWRPGHDEAAWQAHKREYVAAMEAEA